MATHGPAWLQTAFNHLGVREVPGPKHSQTIMGWVRRLGRKLGFAVTSDEIPWCGTFMAEVMDSCGIPIPPIPVRASAWASWGIRLAEPAFGAVLVFSRSGGGHVGLYVGEDDTAYHVLGGNQGNAVSITRIDKNRLTAIRWPLGDTTPLPKGGRRLLARNGQPLSRNEA